MSIDVLSNLVITKVHSVSTLYTQENTKTQRKDRRCWAIIIKHEGETIYRFDGKTIVSDLNHIAILPKGCSYRWECTKSGHFSILEFESDRTALQPISLPVKHGETILKMLKELEYKRNQRGWLSEIESIRDAYSILLAIASLAVEKYVPDSKRQRLQPAIEYISQNYDKNITNDTLASIVGVSTVYFRKMFVEIVGMPSSRLSISA